MPEVAVDGLQPQASTPLGIISNEQTIALGQPDSFIARARWQGHGLQGRRGRDPGLDLRA